MSATAWNFDEELASIGDGRTLHERVQAEPEFGTLRRRMRGFAFPTAAGFLLWYLAYVLLASYARDFMATPVFGRINVGLVIGLAQFVSTFAITTLYVRYAGRHLDPLAEQIRERIETETEAHVGVQR